MSLCLSPEHMDTSPGCGIDIQRAPVFVERKPDPTFRPTEKPCPSCLQREVALCSCPSHQPVTQNASQRLHLAEFRQQSQARVIVRANTACSKDWRGVTGSPACLQGGGKGAVPLVEPWPVLCWAKQSLPLAPAGMQHLTLRVQSLGASRTGKLDL